MPCSSNSLIFDLLLSSPVSLLIALSALTRI